MRCPICDESTSAVFCPKCGTQLKSARRKSKNIWKYAVGVVVVAAVVTLLIYLAGSKDEAEPNAEVAPSLPTDRIARVQADRLFERVMALEEQGDTSEIQSLIPLALQAYSIAGELDADGLYHAILLMLASGNYAGAREDAEQMLTAVPTDLFALSAAGRAAAMQKDTAAAKKYYEQFLAAYDRESKRGDDPVQLHHRKSLPRLKAEAQAYLKSLHA